MSKISTEQLRQMEADLRPLLTDAFLGTLLKTVKVAGVWTCDPYEMKSLVIWAFRLAGKDLPDRETYLAEDLG